MLREIGPGECTRREIPAGSRKQASDGALVERARGGDEGCFEELYERYATRLLSFCRHMLGSKEDAEEVVQSTFVAAHREITGGDRELAIRAWLYAVARNGCLSVLRSRREVVSDSIEVETAGLAAEVEQRAELRELLADLRSLSERQRAALLLTELRDLSQAEVADVLGCEVSKVKGLVFRARSALLERKSAREADCEEIQVELSVANGGTFRKGRLRYHLESCEACSSFLRDVRSQRAQFAIALPVVPSPMLYEGIAGAITTATGGAAVVGLAGGSGGAGASGAAATSAAGAAAGGASVAASVAAGGGAATGAGMAAAAGASGLGAAVANFVTGSTAKVAIVALLGGGFTGAANHVVAESGSPPPAAGPSSPAPVGAPGTGDRSVAGPEPVSRSLHEGARPERGEGRPAGSDARPRPGSDRGQHSRPAQPGPGPGAPAGRGAGNGPPSGHGAAAPPSGHGAAAPPSGTSAPPAHAGRPPSGTGGPSGGPGAPQVRGAPRASGRGSSASGQARPASPPASSRRGPEPSSPPAGPSRSQSPPGLATKSSSGGSSAGGGRSGSGSHPRGGEKGSGPGEKASGSGATG